MGPSNDMMYPDTMLSPRLQLRVAQKQILTPGLVQMVTVLQLNRLELKDMITQEIAENPVLEEAAGRRRGADARRSPAPAGIGASSDPSDQTILETVNGARPTPTRDFEAMADGIPKPSDDAWRGGLLRPLRPRLRARNRTRRAKDRKRSLRRDRFRLLLRRLSRSRIQKPLLGIRRKALLRDVSFLAGDTGRSPALAVERAGHAGSGARRGRQHHRQSGRERLPERIAGRDRRIRRAHASRKSKRRFAIGADRSIRPASRPKMCASACCCSWKAAMAAAASPGRSSRII